VYTSQNCIKDPSDEGTLPVDMLTGLGSRTETSGVDAVRSLVSDAVDDSYMSYPQSRPSDSTHARGQLSVSRQQEIVSVSPGLLQPVPSPSSLIPSPKRRRLEAMETHCDSQPPSDLHGKAALPVICVSKETDSPRTTLVNSTAPREGSTDSGEHSDKLLPSPGLVDKVVDPHERRDTNNYSRNDEKTLPVDRKSPTEDS